MNAYVSGVDNAIIKYVMVESNIHNLCEIFSILLLNSKIIGSQLYTPRT